jgi:histidine ammonia-lyase/phenylalanine ammonia-lyase
MPREGLAMVSPHAETTELLLIDGRSLTLETVERAARHRLTVELASDRHTTSRLRASLHLKERLVAEGIPIYGVTTGFGDSAHRQISPGKAQQLQRTLVRMLGCGVGPFAPVDEARATVLIRANCLARGLSGVRPAVIARLLDLVNHDLVPAIPEQGSVGASGDLVPLSYLAAVLQGERQVFHRGVRRPAAEALAEVGLEPMTLSSKEGLALVNGTSFMSGIAALAARDARRLAATADACTALAAEVLGGLEEPFGPFVHDVAKPHPGQVHSARNVRRMLEGSGLVRRYDRLVAEEGHLDGRGFRELHRRVQDRYSLRCAPHFVGALWDTLDWVERWLAVEINSSNDNPLFDAGAHRVVNGGNFAGSHVGLAMDALRTAVASVADLLDRQLALLVDEKFSGGLPPNLAPPVVAGHPDEGLRHGFKGMQIAGSALAAEALNLCTPVTVFSRSTECHNQDKVSMGTIAARRTREVVRLAERVAAIHLLALCQAADLRGPGQLGRTRRVYDAVRAVSGPLESDREMDGDLEGVVAQLRSGALTESLGLDDPEPRRHLS